MGRQIGEEYRRSPGVERLDRKQVAEVPVGLKERIEGDFYVIAENEDRIVLGNRACPFAEKVLGRPALCMMTSNVFGVIAADNLGYGPAGEVRVHLAMRPEGVLMEVSDTGPGIPSAHRNRIFQPFEQGDPFPTRRAPGTGLGLAVSRELARLLGGELVLAEGDGPGSTFRLLLPVEAVSTS